MLFDSLEYFVFFPVVFVLYWLVFNSTLLLRNLFLLAVSYLFYGWWDPRFLLLIIMSSGVDYWCGLQLDKTAQPTRRKVYLWTSIAFNLGILATFKYFNFFTESLAQGLSMLNMDISFTTLDVVVPVGISFYTFQTMSYTIDVYRKKMPATHNWLTFFCYVSFFPQLVAGPIERARKLVPQFERRHSFSYTNATEGARFILWGLFKKIVIADALGLAVNIIFDMPEYFRGSELYLGSLFFGMQLYCDFSAYSDIAIGSAKMLGFDLMRNFKYPFFSFNVVEFWRRWHISLTTWLRDYVFNAINIPKGRYYYVFYLLNVLLIFVLIGLWHGPRWTYVLYGVAYFVLFVLYAIYRKVFRLDFFARTKTKLPFYLKAIEVGQASSFIIVNIAIASIFRSPDLDTLRVYWSRMFSWSFFTMPRYKLLAPLGMIVLFLLWEGLMRKHWHGLHFPNLPLPARWFIYLVVVFLILYHYGQGDQFIYFQF